MADKYDMGTPLHGERKFRRIRSPLNEMDDVVADLFWDNEPVPQTPEDAHTMHVGASSSNNGLLSQISALLDAKFDEKLAPMTEKLQT